MWFCKETRDSVKAGNPSKHARFAEHALGGMALAAFAKLEQRRMQPFAK
jgi:hypothetical protein